MTTHSEKAHELISKYKNLLVRLDCPDENLEISKEYAAKEVEAILAAKPQDEEFWKQTLNEIQK